MLRVTPVKELARAEYSVLGWQVPDIYAAVKALQEAGVQFERYEGVPQDELGVWTAPGGAARVADGNTLGISSTEVSPLSYRLS